MEFVLPEDFRSFCLTLGKSAIDFAGEQGLGQMGVELLGNESSILAVYQEWRTGNISQVRQLGDIAQQALAAFEAQGYHGAYISFMSDFASTQLGEQWLVHRQQTYLRTALYSCVRDEEQFKRLLRFWVAMRDGATS